MNTCPRKRSASVAWLSSLPLALTVPAALWTFAYAADGKLIRNYDFWLAILAISAGVHLVSYLLTGLPIFLCMFRRPDSLIWRLPFGLTIGALLGAAAPLIMWLMSGGRRDSDLPWQLLICAGYGAITAIAAYRQRPIPQLS